MRVKPNVFEHKQVRLQGIPVCLCELMWMELGRPYVCEAETKARCLERAKREASITAPSAEALPVPPTQ